MPKQIRVKMSTSAEAIINLAQMVIQKHKELGSESPLKVLDWDKQAENITKAEQLHKQAKEYERLAEQMHEQRNVLVNELNELLKQSRDLLKALYRNEPRKLGEFGFTVDDTPRRKKTKEPTDKTKTE